MPLNEGSNCTCAIIIALRALVNVDIGHYHHLRHIGVEGLSEQDLLLLLLLAT
jgi:hypothetical protein